MNEPSKVLLITFINYDGVLNIHLINAIFSQFVKIHKIVIYHKKNTQALIELESVDKALRIKSRQSEICKKSGYRLKFQFTNKKFLIVNKNSNFEHDFDKESASS